MSRLNSGGDSPNHYADFSNRAILDQMNLSYDRESTSLMEADY